MEQSQPSRHEQRRLLCEVLARHAGLIRLYETIEERYSVAQTLGVSGILSGERIRHAQAQAALDAFDAEERTRTDE